MQIARLSPATASLASHGTVCQAEPIAVAQRSAALSPSSEQANCSARNPLSHDMPSIGPGKQRGKSEKYLRKSINQIWDQQREAELVSCVQTKEKKRAAY